MRLASNSGKLKDKLMVGGLWAFIGKFSTSFMSLAINAVLARFLAPSDLGIYFLAFNLALIGAYMGSLGLEQTTLKYVADNMGKKAYTNVVYMIKYAYLSALIGSIIVSALYYIGSVFIFENIFQSAGLYSISILLIGWIVVNIFQILLSETFRGFQDIRLASIFGGILSTFIFLLGFFISIYFEFMEVNLSYVIALWIGSLAISNTLGLFFLTKKIYFIKKEKVDGQKRTLKSKVILSTTLPFLIVAVSLSLLNQVDLWVIQSISSEEDVAIYGTAAKLTMLIGMPIIIVNAVVTPIIAEKFAQGELKSIEKMLRFVGTMATFVAAGFVFLFILFGGPILTLLFGSFYGKGVLILILLSLKQLVIVWNGACSTILAMTGQEKLFMRVVVITGIMSVFLSLGLGVFFGGNGVALGFLIANAGAQIYLWFRLRKTLNIRADADFMGTWVVLKKFIKEKKAKQKAIS